MSLQNRINFYEMTFKVDTDGRLGTKSIIFVEDYLYSYNFIFSLYFLLYSYFFLLDTLLISKFLL